MNLTKWLTHLTFPPGMHHHKWKEIIDIKVILHSMRLLVVLHTTLSMLVSLWCMLGVDVEV